MDTKTINLALQLWDQAGEMPYEVLQERGLLDGFVQFLKKSKLKVGTIFRRTSCHRELEVGQQLEYLYPTSWTSSLENASYFVEHSDDPNVVILCLIANKELQAIYNRRKNIFPIHMYEKNMYGKKFMGLLRTTFLIDENGTIMKIFKKPRSKMHSEEILKFVNGR